MIKITKSQKHIFKGLKWVCLTLSKDKTCRIALTFLKVEKEDIAGVNHLKFVATDGHGLHIYRSDAQDLGFEEGLYEIISNKANEMIFSKNEEKQVYPDYNKVIPQHKHLTFSIDGSFNKHALAGNASLAIANFTLHCWGAINYPLIERALNIASVDFDFYCGSALSGLLFKSPDGMYEGVVMPLRIKNESLNNRIDFLVKKVGE